MSEAEELELLELEEQEKQKAGGKLSFSSAPGGDVPYRAPPTMGAGQAALKGIQDIPTLGWGDEIGAAEQGALAKLTGKGDFSTTYKQAVEGNRRESKQAQEEQPAAYGAAGTLASLPLAKFIPGAGKGGFLSRALKSIASGIGIGGLSGAGQSEADTPGGVAKDAAIPALLGGAMGLPGPLLEEGLGAASKGIVKPTPEAQMLRAKGVPLTLGQMNPRSPIAGVEEAGTSVLGVGKALEAQRNAGRHGWQEAVLKEAMPPGMEQLPQGTVQDKLAASYEGFEPAYAAIKDRPTAAVGIHPMQRAGQDGGEFFSEPMPLKDAFGMAADDASILATDQQRGAVKKFLDNQASLVEHSAPSLTLKGGRNMPVPDTTTTGAILTIRSNIRGAIREATQAQDYATAKLLSGAEQSLTNGLMSQMPQEAADALRAADKQYSLHKVVSDAVRRGGDMPEGFTPNQLGLAVRGATDKGGYARGGGGSLRGLAAAGRETLDSRVPRTGARTLELDPLHLALGATGLPLLGAGGVALLNRPGVQPYALGEGAGQQFLRRALEAVNPEVKRMVRGLPTYVGGQLPARELAQ